MDRNAINNRANQLNPNNEAYGMDGYISLSGNEHYVCNLNRY